MEVSASMNESPSINVGFLAATVMYCASSERPGRVTTQGGGFMAVQGLRYVVLCLYSPLLFLAVCLYKEQIMLEVIYRRTGTGVVVC